MMSANPDRRHDAQMTRRGVLVGAAVVLVCVRTIVRASSLMPVRGLILPADRPYCAGSWYACGFNIWKAR